MKKQIIDIDKEKGTFRVTTQDERWYGKPSKNSKTGLPEYDWYPSSTWIVHYYYTDAFLIEWIAKKGLDEAEAIKIAAGDKGSKIHQGTELLAKGETITIGQKFMNWDKGIDEEITVEEYEAMIAYKNWFERSNIQVLCTEMSVFNKGKNFKYAGTLDEIDAVTNDITGFRQIWIVDKKTSKSISDGHKMQLSSYSHADIDYQKLGITEEEWSNRKLAILQLGYPYNKDKYKFTEVEDCFEDFIKVCYTTWRKKNPDATPKQALYPLSIKLNLPIKEQKVDMPVESGKIKKVK